MLAKTFFLYSYLMPLRLNEDSNKKVFHLAIKNDIRYSLSSLDHITSFNLVHINNTLPHPEITYELY